MLARGTIPLEGVKWVEGAAKEWADQEQDRRAEVSFNCIEMDKALTFRLRKEWSALDPAKIKLSINSPVC